MNRSPYWILTIPYRGAFGEESIVKGWFLKHAESGRFRFAKFALEVGDGGYEHIQAYVVFETQVTFSRVKGLFPKETHIEPRRGLHSEASDYIGSEEKGGVVKWCFSVGSDEEIPEGPGSRSDISKTDSSLKEIQELILSGASEADLWRNPDLFPTMVKYHRGIREFFELVCSRSYSSVSSGRIVYQRRNNHEL